MRGSTAAGRRVARFEARARLRLLLGLRLLSADRSSIDGAAAQADSRLPSVRALAAAACVHRNTAAAVYRDLAAFGLVFSRPGAGTYVATRRIPVEDLDRAMCRAPDLARLLAAELGRKVEVEADGRPGSPEFVPLDTTPPRGGRAIPLAPRGASLDILRRVPAGSTVLLVSRSPTVGRLLRNTLRALRHGRVGLRRVGIAEARAARPTCRALLIDAECLDRHGTASLPPGFVPVRLVAATGATIGRRAG